MLTPRLKDWAYEAVMVHGFRATVNGLIKAGVPEAEAIEYTNEVHGRHSGKFFPQAIAAQTRLDMVRLRFDDRTIDAYTVHIPVRTNEYGDIIANPVIEQEIAICALEQAGYTAGKWTGPTGALFVYVDANRFPTLALPENLAVMVDPGVEYETEGDE